MNFSQEIHGYFNDLQAMVVLFGIVISTLLMVVIGNLRSIVGLLEEQKSKAAKEDAVGDSE